MMDEEVRLFGNMIDAFKEVASAIRERRPVDVHPFLYLLPWTTLASVRGFSWSLLAICWTTRNDGFGLLGWEKTTRHCGLGPIGASTTTCSTRVSNDGAMHDDVHFAVDRA